MILDKLKNADLYSAINPKLKKGFDFLKNNDLKLLEPGRHEIDGSDVYALVSEYETKAPQDCKPEAHQIYTDIQYLVSGREAIGHAILNDQKCITEYNSEKDIAFFSGKTAPMHVEEGMFAVFSPEDIHRPSMRIEGPEMVKKVVVKVKL